MDAFYIAIGTLLFLLAYLFSGLWIFIAIIAVGLSSLYFLLGFPLDRIGSIMRGAMWRTATSYELASVPMFLLMGELIFRTDISERLFRGLSPWTSRIPGRLLHCNIAGCTLFAAVTGSTTATTATVGKITMSELTRRGYDTNIAMGSLAGAGSLGLLIPPSIALIIYGVLSETSIARLFAAGLLPGLLIAFLYSAYIAAIAIYRPSIVPPTTEQYGWRDYVSGVKEVLPLMGLMIMVLGGIYSGIVTPSEAAALGVLAALVMIVLMGQFSFAMFTDSLLGAVRTSCMVLSIMVAAAFMSSAIAFAHVPQEIARIIGGLGLGPIALILLIGLFYMIIGMFLDGMSIMVMTLPITMPLIIAAGWDPVWFGIFLVIGIELGLITPPVGFNLFVLQNLTGRPLAEVATAALPFFVLLVIAALIIIAFPQIVLVLPELIL
jgi:C4-dicarboxylate transporter, DctM subunit